MMKNIVIVFLCFIIMVLLLLIISGNFCHCESVRCINQPKELRFILA